MNAPPKSAYKKTRARKPARRTGAKPKRPTAEMRTAELRARLAERLPDMLDAAIAAYARIAEQAGGEDPKILAATQTAAKAALSHIEQLITLAEAVIRDAPGGHDPRTAEAERLVAEARAALGEVAETPEDGA